jgi:hypothetical protein
MEKKLYCVKVTLYVMAENASEACVAATKARFDIFDCTARRADRISVGWADSVPYNADDERTCAEIMAPQPVISSALFLANSARPEEPRRASLNTAVQRLPG